MLFRYTAYPDAQLVKNHAIVACSGCGGLFPSVNGPVHRYMESSPGCWAAYGRVLAREYSGASLAHVHRFSVDAYAAQHPGQPSSQSMNSVAVHLVRLCLTLERGFDVREANRVMVAISKVKDRFGWLEPPASLGAITVADVAEAESVAAHRQTVHRWARSVWKAWEEHHETIREHAALLQLP